MTFAVATRKPDSGALCMNWEPLNELAPWQVNEEARRVMGDVAREFKPRCSILSAFLHLFRRKNPMPVSLDSLAAKMSTIATEMAGMKAELANAAAIQAQNDQLKAELATAQAAVDAANAADAAAQGQVTQLEAQADAILADIPQPATAPAA